MKTLKNLLLVLTMIFAYSAYGQETLPAASQNEVSPVFTVDLVVYKSSIKGHYVAALVRTKVHKPIVNYTYQWEVNGTPAGKDYKIYYPAARDVKVTVTQHPSGKQIVKEMMPRRKGF